MGSQLALGVCIKRKLINMKAQQGKSMPSLQSDQGAEAFVSDADLSKYDFSAFKPMRFEIEPKSATLTLRLPD